MRKRIRVFDPPMGSPSGIGLITEDTRATSSGSQAELLRMATILFHLKEKGIDVQRANITCNPDVFLNEPQLLDTLMQEGDDFLPACYDEDGLLLSGRYPSTEEVANWYGVEDWSEGLPELPNDAFVALWQEAEAWGMCSSGSCESCTSSTCKS